MVNIWKEQLSVTVAGATVTCARGSCNLLKLRTPKAVYSQHPLKLRRCIRPVRQPLDFDFR